MCGNSNTQKEGIRQKKNSLGDEDWLHLNYHCIIIIYRFVWVTTKNNSNDSSSSSSSSSNSSNSSSIYNIKRENLSLQILQGKVNM